MKLLLKLRHHHHHGGRQLARGGVTYNYSDLETVIAVDVVPIAVCGDTKCTPPETATSCPADCRCDAGETYTPDCDCIDATMEACCGEADPPQTLPLGEACCWAKFHCNAPDMMEPLNGTNQFGHCCKMIDAQTHFCPPGYVARGFTSGNQWAEDILCQQHHDVVYCVPLNDPSAECWQGP